MTIGWSSVTHYLIVVLVLSSWSLAFGQQPMASGGGGPVGFEDLEVWRQAHQLVLRMHKVTAQFPGARLYRAEAQGRRGGKRENKPWNLNGII